MLAIAPKPADRFVEIGPGPGALTLRLAARVAHVTAIEVDERMVAALAPSLPANVRLVQSDVLDVDIASLDDAGPVRVAGNLPYNISSPILFRLLAAARAGGRLIDATLMVQREVAERLQAGPGTKDYGILAILTQLQADVSTVMTLPPGAFRPPPRVHSSVIRLAFRPFRVPVADYGFFQQMVRSMFTQRRKVLGNALSAWAESHGKVVADVLAAAGIDRTRRPETLQLAELARLAELFAST